MIARKLYLFCFVDDLILIYPFYVLLFAEHGLSNLQISIVVATWSIVGIAMEVPSGVLADRFDRRYVLAFGNVMKTLGLILWILEPNFWGYLIGLSLWGIQGAMVSGTFEALLYDGLAAEGKEDSYIRVNGRSTTASFLGVMASAALAALAVQPGYDLLMYASVAMAAVAVALPLFLPAVPKEGEVEDARYFALLKAGVREAFSSRLLLLPIAVVAFAMACEEGFAEFTGLFSSDVGLGERAIAIAYIALVGGGAVGGVLAERVGGTSLRRPIVLLVTSGVLLIVASELANIPAIGLLVVFFFLTQIATVVSGGAVQSAITGPARATVTSVAAFVAHLLNVGVYLTFGFLADAFGRFSAFGIGGAVIVIVGLLMLGVLRRYPMKPAYIDP